MKQDRTHNPVSVGEPSALELPQLQAAALSVTANGVIITDRAGAIVWANSAFERLTGYTLAELEGKSTRVLKSGRTPRTTYEQLWQTILSGTVWRGELINKRKDGSLYDEEMTISPLRNSHGEITHFVAIKQDVSERKALQERFHLLATAVESSPEMVGITKPEGGIFYVNGALQKALQLPKDELMGQHLRSILSQVNSRELLQEIETKTFQTGRWQGECLVPRKDGTAVPVLLSSSAVVAANGDLLGILGVAQDITERKRADERIAFLSQAVEGTNEFIAIGDAHGLITFANQSWLRALGYSEQDLIGKPFTTVLSPNNPPGLAEEINAKTYAGGWRGECLHLRKDGTDMPVFLSTGLLHDHAGQTTGVFGLAQDISEHKKAESELLLKNALLEAQAETTIDGILAVDESLKIILYNQQFVSMWNLPPSALHQADDTEMLAHILKQVKDPDSFLEHVRYIRKHNYEKSKGEILLADGRVIERYSSPLVDPKGCYHGRIWYLRDITSRVRSEERLLLWSRVLDQSAEGIFICDPREQILLVNTAFEKLTGYSATDAMGKTPRILKSGQQSKAFYAEMWKSISDTGTWSGEIWNRRKNGELFVEWLSISAVCDKKGPVTHYVGIFSDITVRKQAEERVVHLAHHDALTDLPNRVLLMDRLGQLTKSAQRRKTKIAAVFIDLDRFKEVNDSLGHDAGDALLQIVAKRISNSVRQEDTVARIGGDEFVVIFQGLQQIKDAAGLTQRMLACVVEPVLLRGLEITVTASMGISLFPDDASTAEDMIRNADAAMYQAKGAGRNSYQFYTSDLNKRALELLSMENALRRGIDRREFVLHYQPQIDIPSGRIVGAEALVRWNHPELGLLMPGKFISIAEERGLIARLGGWVVEEASRQAALWQRSGSFQLPIAVNVSAVQFRQKDFIQHLARTVREHGVAPSFLELELTESIVMRDAESTIQILRTLNEMGFQLSIDDFGTGYSSLSYLRRFPLSKIKIDQSFVADATRDEGAASIVTAVISLARSLKLKVIAEGVQTPEQLHMLRAQRCDQAQGYLFSRALPCDDFEALVLHWQPQPSPPSSA